jgi:hypothetical protein
MRGQEKHPHYPSRRGISITKDLTSNIKYFNNNQYDLKQNNFDPSKSSPPNEFMEKLRLRMSVYYSFSKKDAIFTKE